MAKPYRLLIVGAAALGRQILGWAMDVPEGARDWEIAGFLDDRPDILDGYNRPFSILGDPKSYRFSETDRVICAIADPRTRLHYCEMLTRRGARLITFIHPTVHINSNCRLGEGCVLGPMSALDCDVMLGNHVVIYGMCGIGHDTVIGDGCQISPHAVICGDCKLGRGVFIGTNATLNENAVIGDYATVASGSVVSGHVPGKTVVMGIPAMPIREWAKLVRASKLTVAT